LGLFRKVAPAAAKFLVVLGLIAIITLFCKRLVHANATTGGFAYLVGILIIATAWGLAEASAASVTAMLCLNYYFLPPVGTFTITDPQNWVALVAFLATSFTASELSLRARRQAQEAIDRRLEMERLYAVSRAILLAEPGASVAKQIAQRVAATFEFPAVALYDRLANETYAAGPEDLPEVADKLRDAAVQGTQFRDDAKQLTVAAIRLGGEPIGGLAIRGPGLSDTALQALANLVAIGLEKVRAQEAATRAEAARESEELKSTLLDALAHEFKTPLTSIKAAASSLLSRSGRDPVEERELATIIDDETERLARLVTEAIQMARIEAGKLQLHRDAYPVRSLIKFAIDQMKPRGEGEIRTEIQDNLPPLFADPDLMVIAIRQLIDNALKYSSPGTPVTISARAENDGVLISVLDHGPGIPEREQARIFEKFHRSATDRYRITGSGMGLTIAREIVRAHGGDITLRSTPGKGSDFRIIVPGVLQETPA
jgi:two-component system sensor histidine kinase KdpD